MVQFLKDIKIKYWNNTEYKYKLEWIILFAILGFCYFTMYYTDYMWIYDEAYQLVNCTLEGRFFDFYGYAKANGILDITRLEVPNYDIYIFLLIAIWGIPVWIANKAFGISIVAVPCLLWMKLLIMIFVVLACRVFWTITEYFFEKESYRRWALFALASSALFVLPIFEVTQADIFAVTFMLLGFYNYLKRDFRKFVFWFAIAIPFKMFALFLFIPLLLLWEKRIIHIAFKLVLAAIPMIISWLLFYGRWGTEEKGNLTGSFIDKILGLEIFDRDVFASVFIIAYLLLCVWTYIRENDENNQLALYAAFASFAIVFSLMHSEYPYWIMMLMPYMVLVSYNNRSKWKINTILEMGYTWSFVIWKAYDYFYVYGSGDTYGYTLMRNVGVSPLGYRDSLRTLMDRFQIGEFMGSIHGIFFGCIIALLVINYPTDKIDTEYPQVERGLMWCRLGALLAYFGLEILIGLVGVMG